ncbi:MAG: hypothetical protein IPJ11_05130 [Gemmatimonadetes bacterium]|nr:hypothetical protein [Gemmatimonadota bacterium]
MTFPPLPWLLAIAVLMPIVAWFFQRRHRERLLVGLRAAWGRVGPIDALDDDRVMEAWLESRRTVPPETELDERTWVDLDLDRVVATLDRTNTGLGRQRLYWRFRSGASWMATPDLESLVQRLREDTALREAIGLQLRGASSHLGYGLWPITRPELIVVRWWYWAFPILALTMAGSIVGIVFVPKAGAAHDGAAPGQHARADGHRVADPWPADTHAPDRAGDRHRRTPDGNPPNSGRSAGVTRCARSSRCGGFRPG